MQVTNQQILELASAFRRLDGERGKSYKFGPKTRMQLAKRIRAVTELKTDIEDAQKKMFTQYGLTGGFKQVGQRIYPNDDPGKTRLYNLEWNDFLRESEDIALGKFLLADLDLQNNSVSVQTLAHLLTDISDAPKQASTPISLTLPDIQAAAKAFANLETEAREFKASYVIKLSLAEIWRQLSATSDALEIQRQAMITERKLGNYRLNADNLWESADDTVAYKAFEDAWNVIKNTPITLDLPTVKCSELDLDTNDIPGSVLSDLLPVLTEDVDNTADAAPTQG